MNVTQSAVLAAFGGMGSGNHGSGEAPVDEDAFGDRQSELDHYLGECGSVHSEEAAGMRPTQPVLWSANWCNKSCPAVTRAGLSRRPFFLNFDVAILFNRAQHLLALARKVEQGGLNG
jgi:hypothetical protein